MPNIWDTPTQKDDMPTKRKAGIWTQLLAFQDTQDTRPMNKRATSVFVQALKAYI